MDLDRIAGASGPHLDRRGFLRLGVGAAGTLSLGAFLAACSSSSTPTATKTGSSSPASLLSQAKAEGQLNTIALPADWANYGTIISTFQSKYGIKINNAAPDDSSAQELTALKALAGQSRAPDVVDVAPQFAAEGASAGLFQPFENAYWDLIPASAKDANGMWVADYYGVVSFGVNTSLVKDVPTSFADLTKPIYKKSVALDGDPRSAGAAFAGVWAAALANGGSLDDITPGIEFFANLKKIGNFTAVSATPATSLNGETPITLNWDYLNFDYAPSFVGHIGWRTVVPTDAVFGGYYCQAIAKQAPHPAAAKLWQDFLYSDEGQLLWLAGGAHPIRFNELVAAGKVPASLAAKLPPAAPYKHVVFPTVAQTNAAAAIVAAQWGPKVAGA